MPYFQTLSFISNDCHSVTAIQNVEGIWQTAQSESLL